MTLSNLQNHTLSPYGFKKRTCFKNDELTGFSYFVFCIFSLIGYLDILRLFTNLISDYSWKSCNEGDVLFLKQKNFNNLLIDLTVLIKLLLVIILFSFFRNTGLAFYIILYLNLTTFCNIPEFIMRFKNRPKASSYIRASILSVLNYLELVFGFAYYYSYFNCLRFSNEKMAENIDPTYLDHIYFSFVTVSTIGLNNLEVYESTGKILVMCQAFIFLIFVMIFMSYNISRINQ